MHTDIHTVYVHIRLLCVWFKDPGPGLAWTVLRILTEQKHRPDRLDFRHASYLVHVRIRKSVRNLETGAGHVTRRTYVATADRVMSNAESGISPWQARGN